MIALERDDYTEALRRLGMAAPRPKRVVIVSAHWEARGPVRVTGADRPSLIYDFSGFPPELSNLRYPSPGDPSLASDIVKRLSASGIEASVDPRRGLDHGAWVPMRHAFPEASVPVLEVSLPIPRTPRELVRVGEALGPLRDNGVLLIGSGGVVHNLRRLSWDDKGASPEPWAEAFDRWVGDRVRAIDLAGLEEYRTRAPHAADAVPTTEHFDPIFVVMGASAPGDSCTPIFEGFHYGTLSMRSFALDS